MSRFFNPENVVWRFIGNLYDFFLLSLYWYLCCLLVVPAGSGTCALYYVTLKLASQQESYTSSSYWRSFKENFKQATVIWIIFLLAGLLIGFDIMAGLTFPDSPFVYFLPAFGIVGVLYLLLLSTIFPVVARCSNSTGNLIRMCFPLMIHNFLPVLSTFVVSAAIFSVGIFLFWPLLLIAPGLSAYWNSFIFNRIFTKYHLNLVD